MLPGTVDHFLAERARDLPDRDGIDELTLLQGVCIHILRLLRPVSLVGLEPVCGIIPERDFGRVLELPGFFLVPFYILLEFGFGFSVEPLPDLLAVGIIAQVDLFAVFHYRLPSANLSISHSAVIDSVCHHPYF